MIDEDVLIDAFRKASAADVVRVPPVARIVALAEYAKVVQRRRRFAALVVLASALAAVCAGAVIVLAPHAFPLRLSPGITPLLVLGAVEAFWVMAATDDLGGRIRE